MRQKIETIFSVDWGKNYEKIEIGNTYHFNFLQEIAGIGREN